MSVKVNIRAPLSFLLYNLAEMWHMGKFLGSDFEFGPKIKK